MASPDSVPSIQQILESAIDHAIVAMDLDGRITRWSEGAHRIMGWTEAEMLGDTAHRFFTPEDRQAGRVEREMQGALEAGRSQDERWHLRKDGERFWASGEMTPLKREDGTVAGFVKILRDRTEQRLANQQLLLLQRELEHRMKNTLSMVQAIVTQSLRHSETMQQAEKVIAERLAALGRAQDILTQRSWTVADIGDVIDGALEAHRTDGKFQVSGPPAQISAQQGLGMALAIHELATNALKYGSLSSADGKVLISWEVGPSGNFSFEWREIGGPAVSPPARKGFGSRLVERIVASYFEGEANLEYDPEGVVFTLKGSLTGED